MTKTEKWKTFLEIWNMAISENKTRRQAVEILDKHWQSRGWGNMTRRKMMSMYHALKYQFAIEGKKLATIENMSDDHVDWPQVVAHGQNMACVCHCTCSQHGQ